MSNEVIDKPVAVESFSPAAAPTFERNITFVAKGGGVTFAGKMFLMLVRLVTAVWLARLLGADQYGLYSLGLSAANIGVGIAVFGLDSALVRYIAILASRRDEKGVWGALQIGIGGAMFFSVITGTAIYAFAFPIAEQWFNEPKLVPLLQLVSVAVPILTLSELLAGANRGFRRMDYPVIAQFVCQPIIRLILIAVVAVIGMDAQWAIITFGLADLLASFILLYFLNKEFRLKRPLRAARHDTKEIMGFSFPFWLSGLMYNFHDNIQTLLIGSLNTITGVGIFSIANQITMISSQFSSSINVTAKPVMAELHDRNDLEQMGRIYQTTNKWTVMAQIPIFLIMILFPTQILSIFGESFTNGAQALVILAIANMLLASTGMGGIIIDMTGYTKLKLVNSILRLVVFLGLDIWLIPRWGILGAATAALIGESTINLLRLLQVYLLFRLQPFNHTFLKPVAAGLLACASALLVNSLLPVHENLIFAFTSMAVLGAVYIGATLLLGLSPEEQALWENGRRRLQTLRSRF